MMKQMKILFTLVAMLVFAFTSLCWGIYNVSIKSYAGAAFDFANMTSFLYNAFKNKEKEN